MIEHVKRLRKQYKRVTKRIEEDSFLNDLLAALENDPSDDEEETDGEY